MNINDFYFVYFPVGYDFIKTMECTFKFIPKNINIIVVTPHPELINIDLYDFNLIVLKLDDLRDDWSKQHEIIIYETDAKKYRDKLFESQKKGIRFPYSIYRFIIPWLADRNITKFAIIDTCCLINFNDELLNIFEHYNKICDDKQLLFGVTILMSTQKDEFINVSKDVFQKYDIDVKIIDDLSETFQFIDGFLKGFWFNDKNALMLFYNLWDGILKKCYETNSALIRSSTLIVSDEWLLALISHVFNVKYNIKTQDITSPDGRRLVKHIYHPENYCYYLPHGLYTSSGFIENSDRKIFIEQNRETLIKFFQNNNGIPVHRIHEVIYDFNK